MTPEIYNIDNYLFSIILIVGGTATYFLRKWTGTLPSNNTPVDEEAVVTRSSLPRRDGRKLIVLGLVFLPLSFFYAYFIKQPQVDRQKPHLQAQPPVEKNYNQ